MPTPFEILQEMAAIYEKKVTIENKLNIQFILIPENKIWFLYLLPGEPVNITETCSEQAQLIFQFSIETLSAIYSGKMTGLTAMGRENMSDQTPLDFRLGKDVTMTPALMSQLLSFVQRFFNPTHPEMVKFTKSAARMVHGAWAIPMFYHSGFRSGWYQLDKGQRLNEPGDVNPFQQAFIIISGNGYAKMGDNSIEVRAGEAYYIPPQSDHVLWNENPEPLQLIYLAWGKNA